MYLTQGLHRALQQHPDRVATRFSGRERTYREHGDRVARLAGALLGLGLEPRRYASQCWRSIPTATSIPDGGRLGGRRAEPDQHPLVCDEIIHALNDSASTILLVDEAFRASVEALRSVADTVQEVIYLR